MLDDFTPIIHELPGRTVKVWALGDAHIGAKEADLDGLQAFVDRLVQDPDSYLVLVGDLMDFGTKNSPTSVYEAYMSPSMQIDYTAELLAPVADRILGCVGGNHELRGVKEIGIDPLYSVMSMVRRSDGTTLQDIYRQSMAFIRVVLDRNGTKDHYALLLTHGKTANKKRHFAYAVEGVDAIVTGHTHDGIVEKPAKLVFNHRNKVSIEPLVSITATSWLASSPYALRGLMLPKATSDPQCLVLEFTGTNNRAGKVSVSW